MQNSLHIVGYLRRCPWTYQSLADSLLPPNLPDATIPHLSIHHSGIHRGQHFDHFLPDCICLQPSF
jgi:hypothetical protein